MKKSVLSIFITIFLSFGARVHAQDLLCAPEIAPQSIAHLIVESPNPEAALKKALKIITHKPSATATGMAEQVKQILNVLESQLKPALMRDQQAESPISLEAHSVDAAEEIRVICRETLNALLTLAKSQGDEKNYQYLTSAYGINAQKNNTPPENSNSQLPNTINPSSTSTPNAGSSSPSSTLQLAAPVLVGPLGIIDVRQPTAEWNEVPGASRYEVWWSLKKSPTNALLRQTVTELSVLYPQELPYGNYSVWVRAIDPFDKTGPWSNPRHFSILPGQVMTALPSGDVVDRTPTFSWLSVPGAQRYELWVSFAGTPSTALYKETTGNLVLTPDRFLKPGKYAFWVRATSGEFNGPWSAVRTFTVNEDKSICPGAGPAAGFNYGRCIQDDQIFSSRGGGCTHKESKLVISEPLNSISESSRLSWQAAEAACSALTQGGFCDWRLPSLDDFRRLTIRADLRQHVRQNYPYSWASDKWPNPLPNDPTGEAAFQAFGWSNYASAIFAGSMTLGVHCVRDDNGLDSPLETPTPTVTPTPQATATPTPLPTIPATATPTSTPAPVCSDSGSSEASAGNCKKNDTLFSSKEGGCQHLSTGLVVSKPGHTNNSQSYLTWDAAKSYCENLVQGCYSDWRLPKLAEYQKMAASARLQDYVLNTGAMAWTDTTEGEGTHREFWWAANRPQGGNFPDSTRFGVHCIRGSSEIKDTPRCSPLKIPCSKDAECCSGRCFENQCAYPDKKTVIKNREGGFCIDHDDCEQSLSCHSTGYYCTKNRSYSSSWKKVRVIDMNYEDAIREIGRFQDTLVLFGGGRSVSNNPPRFSNRTFDISLNGGLWRQGGSFPGGAYDGTLLDFQGRPHFCGMTSESGSEMCYQGISTTMDSEFVEGQYNLTATKPGLAVFRIEGTEHIIGIGNSNLPGSGYSPSRRVVVSKDAETFRAVQNDAGSENVLPFDAQAATVVKVIDPNSFKETLLTIRSYSGITQVATSTDAKNWKLASTFNGWAYESKPAIFVVNNKVIIEGFIPDLVNRDSMGRPTLVPKLFVSYDAGQTWETKPGFPEIPGMIHRSPIPIYFNEHLFRVVRTSDAAGSGSVLYAYPFSDLPTPRGGFAPTPTPTPNPNVCDVLPDGQMPPGACVKEDTKFKTSEGGCHDIQDRLVLSKLNPVSTWVNAMAYCEQLREGGKCDWRLPNRKELQTLLIQSNMLGGGHFVCGNNWLWTSEQSDSNSSWTVQCANGQSVAQYQGSTAIATYCVRGEGLASQTSTYSCGVNDAQRLLPPPGACRTQDTIYKTGLGGCAVGNLKIWSKQRANDIYWALKRPEAIRYCAQLQEGGYCDWRLPMIDELAALAKDSADKYLSIDTNRVYWSHPDDGSSYNSYDLRAKKGTIFSSETGNFTVCIRDAATQSTPGACIQYDRSGRFSSSRGGCYDTQNRVAWSSEATLQMDWFEAKMYCEGLAEGGFNNWALPTKTQFDSLGVRGSQNFLGLSIDKFWTSSVPPSNASYRYYYDVSGKDLLNSLKADNRLRVVCLRSAS